MAHWPKSASYIQTLQSSFGDALSSGIADHIVGIVMALNSDRFESVAVVNPDEGIYVEMEGIMEVGSTKLDTGGLVSVHYRFDLC